MTPRRSTIHLVGDEPCPLPADPDLAALARALNEAGQWAEVFDAEWHGLFMTDEARFMYGGRAGLAPYPVGAHLGSPERVNAMLEWGGGQWTMEIIRAMVLAFGGWILADTPGGRAVLRDRVDPRLHDLVDQLQPVELPAAQTLPFQGIYSAAGAQANLIATLTRVRDGSGGLAATVVASKPAVGMAAITRMTALADLRHFERTERVARPARRSAAILFADLESSSALARRLPTSAYFHVVRRLAWLADQSVVDAGGVAGSHSGDGVAGFFLSETAGDESAAAAGCIAASRAIRAGLDEVAVRSELESDELAVRFGLHWGANLYVGQVATAGRTEVTALGDQVNEAARIEACATGGRALASKDLIERLAPQDAVELGIDIDHLSYTQLRNLETATDKARRDAPAIAVCNV